MIQYDSGHSKKVFYKRKKAEKLQLREMRKRLVELKENNKLFYDVQYGEIDGLFD